MTNQAPPEGQLIANAQKRLGLSARKAAVAAGISDSRWRHIINGYQPVGQGQTIPVRAPADTLARMANVVGVEPFDLAQAGREDAAEELRTMFPPHPDEHKDPQWKYLARAVTARIHELGFDTPGMFVAARNLNPNSMGAVLAGVQLDKPGFYLTLERALRWKTGSIEAVRSGGEPTPRKETSGSGSSLSNASNEELLAEVARRFSPDSDPKMPAASKDRDNPDNYDLAAHPYFKTEHEKFEEQHGDRGEENQDPEGE